MGAACNVFTFTSNIAAKGAASISSIVYPFRRLVPCRDSSSPIRRTASETMCAPPSSEDWKYFVFIRIKNRFIDMLYGRSEPGNLPLSLQSYHYCQPWCHTEQLVMVAPPLESLSLSAFPTMCANWSIHLRQMFQLELFCFLVKS